MTKQQEMRRKERIECIILIILISYEIPNISKA